MTQSGELAFSDFLNLFFSECKYNIGALIRALQSTGQFQSLAEPNLIAYNGQEASFLAGGEFPVPVVQGKSGTVTIQFKEFGIRLTFKPTIAGDVIRLKVRPEVSALDFANGVSLAASEFRRSRRGAPRPTSSCATDSRSPSRACSTTSRRRTRRRFRS